MSLALIKGKATINPGFLPVLNSGKIRLPGEYVTFNDLKEYNARPFAGKGLFVLETVRQHTDDTLESY